MESISFSILFMLGVSIVGGLISFLLVGVSTGLFLYIVFGNFSIAFAAGIVFGAVASATDSASTIDVLWEYRGLGVLDDVHYCDCGPGRRTGDDPVRPGDGPSQDVGWRFRLGRR